MMHLTLPEARALLAAAERGRVPTDWAVPLDKPLNRALRKLEDEVRSLRARDRLSEAEQELKAALHQLWLEAGEPSVRQMSRQIRVRGDGEAAYRSHMTWHNALTCNPVPTLATLRALVTYLEGDLGRFEELWFRAKGKVPVA